ncbi:MAG: hydrogenase iron-sulfur subunit [Deltaproteobacteria bacterium]|jgi:heterodisulfide reductase subunit A|nr:hydrogenase iron-sulfur subunit [Deltaproteobacteria bacterium]
MGTRNAVLYCTCCDTLSSVLPVAALERKLSASPPAPLVIAARRLCAREDAQACIAQAKADGAAACVAAGCSHLARGAEALRHLGADPPTEWVDIREACVWIHAGRPDQILEKAVDYILMGFAALERRPAATAASIAPPVDPVLVVGAGPAGLAAASVLANAGIPVALAERRGAPGGMLRQLGLLFPDLSPASEVLARLDGGTRSGVDRRFGCTVTRLEAVETGYLATLFQTGASEEFNASAVILATGALPVMPAGLFRHKELEGVGSQMELETLLGKAESGQAPLSSLPDKALFLQCVAARSAEHPYCSAICCPTAVKNALRLKMLKPEAEVTLVHRNMVMPGIALEALYRRATEAGVRLRGYDPAHAPEALGRDKVKGLRIVDALSGETDELPADMLVCSTPLKPSPDATALARGIGLRLDDMGFVCGREPMQPLEPARPGVFLCGAARWPATVAQAAEQGSAAGLKALHYMRNSGLAPAAGAWSGEPTPPAQTRGEACSRCGRCAAACPYDACKLPESGPMRIWSLFCRRCGACAAACPTGAAVLPADSFSSLLARIKASARAFAPATEKPKVLVFACRWCALLGAERAGRERIALDPAFRLIPVECAGGVSTDAILRALADGYHGVAVMGCHFGGCRHNESNRNAHARLELLGAALACIGIRRERLLLSWGTAHEAAQFADLLSGFIRDLEQLAASPDLPIMRGDFTDPSGVRDTGESVHD